MLLLGAVRGLYRLFVVRRDRPDTLRAIIAGSEHWPAGTAVMLDRRGQFAGAETRRMASDPHSRERRANPDSMWHTYGFAIVETTTVPSQAVILCEPAHPFR
jgi:hypothetical protein